MLERYRTRIKMYIQILPHVVTDYVMSENGRIIFLMPQYFIISSRGWFCLRLMIIFCVLNKNIR